MSGNNIDENVIDSDDSDDTVHEEKNDKEIAQITFVLDYPLIQKYKKTNGEKFWKCVADGCGKEYKHWNTTKAMAHGARFLNQCRKCNVKKCNGKVTEQELGLFQNLLKKHLNKLKCRKRVNLAISDNITTTQQEVSQQLVQKKLKHSTKDSVSSRQLSIKSCINMGSGTVDNYNAADMDTAIAELIYCAGLPFSFAKNHYFRKLLQVAKTSPKGYFPPKRNIASGRLLNDIHKKYMDKEIEQLNNNAEIYGFGFFRRCGNNKESTSCQCSCQWIPHTSICNQCC